jgi:hypothetical protein
MSSMPEPARMDVLARRVRWLDSYRRMISVALAVGVLVVVVHEAVALLGPAWPRVLSAMFGVLCALAAWWLIEVAFAWVTACWEAEHDRHARELALPRAELVRRRN